MPLAANSKCDECALLLQSTLNCELLDSSFGLELRWTLTAPSDGGESDQQQSDIILQLVSRTASDRYLAFGVRNPETDSG